VAIVGGGPDILFLIDYTVFFSFWKSYRFLNYSVPGLSAAIKLRQLAKEQNKEIRVCLVEKGSTIGKE
jgi:hypothetical protein